MIKKAVYVEESNEKSARFSVGDRVRISKSKNILAKGYTPNWSKEIFVVNKIKNGETEKILLAVFMIENYKRLCFSV